MGDYWSPAEPVRNLPKEIRKSYKSEARRLYDDLVRRKLTIGTVVCYGNGKGYGLGQKLRVVEQSNPSWYSDFYKTFKRRSKKRGYTKGNPRKKRGNGVHTFCERKRVEQALFRIISGEDGRLGAPRRKSGPSNLYQTLVREIIHQNLIEGFFEEEYQIGVEPDNKVRRFFGLEEIASEEFWTEQGFEACSEDEAPF
ncbi:MAG: hypothetical protein ACP5NS_01605 [Candidatus Pacearchaeota archaeon]